MKTVTVIFLFLVFFSPPTVFAEDEDNAASKNYEKSQKELLPGEKVTTPTGQQLRVWSTRGKVETSPAPEPFKDPDRVRIDDADVIIAPESREKDSFEVSPSDR